MWSCNVAFVSLITDMTELKTVRYEIKPNKNPNMLLTSNANCFVFPDKRWQSAGGSILPGKRCISSGTVGWNRDGNSGAIEPPQPF